MKLILVRFAACLFLVSLAALAQTQSAGLVGRVLDPHDSAVPRAEIRVVNDQTNEIHQTLSGEHGEFTITNLAPGSYTVTVSKDGFDTLRQTGIVLDMEQTGRLELKLKVGAVSQSVVVMAEAPMINTENGSKGQIIGAVQIAEMPLNGRNFSDLAFLVPGVSANATGAEGAGFAINGARADNTNFFIDGYNDQNPRGGSLHVTPNLDAMQEFKMETSNYSPELGRLSGGVMNMVLKSGGNQLHGVVFEYLRNDYFDARNFFNAGKAKLRQNQFGATVGGPVEIPKVYNGHDRTFFMFSWESLRQINGQSNIGLVPTNAQRAGDFTQPIADPLSAGTCPGSGSSKGACFPGGAIPQSRLSAQALAAQALYPLPNRAGVNNALVDINGTSNWDGFIFKIDEHISQKDTLSFRFIDRDSAGLSPQGGGQGGTNLGLFGLDTNSRTTLPGLTYTRIITPTLINEARLGYARTKEDDIGVHQGTNYAAKFGIPGTTTDPSLIGLPLFSISGYATLGDATNDPQNFAVTAITIADTVTWVKGRHLFKFGGDVVRERHFEPYIINSRGTFNFTGSWSGQPYADFLLGYLNSDSRLVGTVNNYLLKTDYGMFAQDEWKLTPRLTLNLGLRYEIPKPITDKYGRLTNFLPGPNVLAIPSSNILQSTGAAFTNPAGVETANQLGLPSSLVYTDYKDFAPRFGFAWRPFGGDRTVIRSGYGIFYGIYIEQTVRNSLGDAFPFVTSQTINATASPTYLTLANPFPVLPNLTGNLSTLALSGYQVNAPTPYMQSWNMTVEHQLDANTSLEAAYVGSKGTHLPIIININTPYREPQYAPNFPFPFPGFGTISYFDFEINSSYTAGIFSLRRRFVHNFFYTASYTYSKSIDEESQINGSSAGGFSGLQDVRNAHLDRARSDFDTPHVFNMSFSWTAPFQRNFLVKGWQLAGSGQLYSGKPITLKVNNTNLNLGQASRPNRIAKGTVPDPNANEWYNVAAFPQVPTGAFLFGNSGRNILDGPGTIQINLALSRNFRIRERPRLQFRWEVFDVTNHPNLGLPVNAVNAANAATITSANSSRLMQLALRYSF